MKNLYSFSVIALLCSATILLSREETELVIGYIPETQTIIEPTPTPIERQAIAVLAKASQAQGQQEPESSMSPFQDPVIV